MMQTRGAAGFITRSGQLKLSYNNFDSYEEGLGAEIARVLYEITTRSLWKQFEKNVEKLILLDEEQKPSPELQERYKLFSDTDVSDGTLSDTYCLLRKVQGADGWREIMEGELEHVIDSNDFIKNSLYCEYGYILNFKDNSFDFYSGFQQSPQKNNPFGEKKQDNGYYPCALLYRFSLLNIKRYALEKDASDFIGWMVETMMASEQRENWMKIPIL